MSVRHTLSMITHGRRSVACKKPSFGIDCKGGSPLHPHREGTLDSNLYVGGCRGAKPT